MIFLGLIGFFLLNTHLFNFIEQDLNLDGLKVSKNKVKPNSITILLLDTAYFFRNWQVLALFSKKASEQELKT